jgi:hypothetical protein
MDLTNFIKSDLVGAERARQSGASAWKFPPLAECRAAWDRRYGPQDLPEQEDWVWWQDV